jgi:hypothetical protein
MNHSGRSFAVLTLFRFRFGRRTQPQARPYTLNLGVCDPAQAAKLNDLAFFAVDSAPNGALTESELLRGGGD